MFQCFETNLKHLVIYFIYRLVATILLYNLYVSMFQCFTETKCMPWDFCGGFVKALATASANTCHMSVHLFIVDVYVELHIEI